MVTARRLDGAGTPEGDWRAWRALRLLPPLDVPPPRRVVAVAPHPDDEVLGAGGLLHQLHRGGCGVVIIAVTDGEASHPRSPTITPARLAALRLSETGTAHARLGIDPARIRLGIPDGHIGSYRAELCDRIQGNLGAGDWCLAPWSGDGHPDHNATGAAAQLACTAARATLVSYLVWAWHWSRPADPEVPWHRARRVALSRPDRARKRWALRAFRSQTQPLSAAAPDAAILPPAELDHHRRDFEVFLL